MTEGAIFLTKEFYEKGIFPPIAVLPSLSRFMKSATTRTHAFHESSQLFALYAIYRDSLKIIREIKEKESMEFFCCVHYQTENLSSDLRNTLDELFMDHIFERIRDKYITREDQYFLQFGPKFESLFLNQTSARTDEENSKLVWSLFRLFPQEMLTKIPQEVKAEKY